MTVGRIPGPGGKFGRSQTVSRFLEERIGLIGHGQAAARRAMMRADSTGSSMYG